MKRGGEHWDTSRLSLADAVLVELVETIGIPILLPKPNGCPAAPLNVLDGYNTSETTYTISLHLTRFTVYLYLLPLSLRLTSQLVVRLRIQLPRPATGGIHGALPHCFTYSSVRTHKDRRDP